MKSECINCRCVHLMYIQSSLSSASFLSLETNWTRFFSHKRDLARLRPFFGTVSALLPSEHFLTIPFWGERTMRPEEEIIDAELLPDGDEQTSEPATTRKRLIEQVLSPQALQWMMTCGGGMLILGFVIWLWSVGIFENPLVVASLVGAATLGTLAAGIAMVRLSRYQLAGRGIALLGSIALPLNLWLYDAQGLVTLADGGHLWIPAALCCLIYAAVARVLKDSTFVYALVGGVVMTGMLILADETVGRFWTLVPPVTFLVVVGWVCAFAERLFSDDEGDFSRKNFGLAFHRAGVLVVVGGLTLLLGNHVILWINWALGTGRWALVATQPQKIWALGIIASSAVGFGLQSVVHQSRLYRIVTALLIAWMVPTTLDVLSITVSVSHLATAIALLTIAGNGFVARIRARKSDSQLTRLSTTVVKFVEEFSLVATSTVGVLAIGQFFAQFEYPQGIAFFGSIGWMSVLQIVTAGLAACAVGFRGSLESGKSTAESETDRLIIVIGSALITAAIMTGVMVQGLSDQVVIAIAVGLPVLVAATSLVAKNPAVKNGTAIECHDVDDDSSDDAGLRPLCLAVVRRSRVRSGEFAMECRSCGGCCGLLGCFYRAKQKLQPRDELLRFHVCGCSGGASLWV